MLVSHTWLVAGLKGLGLGRSGSSGSRNQLHPHLLEGACITNIDLMLTMEAREFSVTTRFKLGSSISESLWLMDVSGSPSLLY